MLGLRLGNARLRDLMVGTQVAVCLFLIIGASLLIRGSMRSLAVGPGYETRRVAFLDFNFSAGSDLRRQWPAPERRGLKDRGRGLGRRSACYGQRGAPSTIATTSPNYLETLGVPLLRGRDFAEAGETAESAAILSESAAEALWPGMNPIGRTVVLDASNQFHGDGEIIPRRTSYQVIAVAWNMRASIPRGDDSRKIYLPLPADRLDDFSLLVRTDGDQNQLISALGKQMRSVDANVTAYCATIEELLTSTPTFVISRLLAILRRLSADLVWSWHA